MILCCLSSCRQCLVKTAEQI